MTRVPPIDVATLATVTVTFHPDLQQLETQLRALPDTAVKVIVDNASPQDLFAGIESLVARIPNARVLREDANTGLAAAINRGVQEVSRLPSVPRFVLLLDQDSEPQPGSVETMVAAFQRLESTGYEVGCVGPLLLDPATGLTHGFHQCTRWRWKRAYPKPGATEPVPCANLNGSGTLVETRLFTELGGLDESLFIDHVDTEWAFRVLAAGYTLWGVPNAIFRHSMGQRSVRFWFFGWRVWPQRSPERHYYLFRNAVVLLHRPYVPKVWKAWAIAKLLMTVSVVLIVGPSRCKQAGNMARGVINGEGAPSKYKRPATVPDPNLTIAIDASRLRHGSTGVGRYTQSLLRPLDTVIPDARFILFAKREHNVSVPSQRWQVIVDRHIVWSRLPVTLWIHYRLGKLLRRYPLDVFWAANSFIPSSLSRSTPSVVTVFDLRHVLYPRDMPPVTMIAHRLWFSSSMRCAKSIVAISHGTSDRMLHLFGRGADAIVPPSVPPLPVVDNMNTANKSLRELGVHRPFLLTVGKSPCKNLGIAEAAVRELKRSGALAGYELAMVGPLPGTQVASRGASHDTGWIRKLGRVTDAQMSALYAAAELLVFPSLYEGFGIPVLEARAAGCRVVTTDSPELREAGGTDATYVEPTLEGVAAGIERALRLPRPNPNPDAAPSWNDAAQILARTLRVAAGLTGTATRTSGAGGGVSRQ